MKRIQSEESLLPANGNKKFRKYGQTTVMGKVRFLPANAISRKTTLSSSLSDDASITTINIIISVSLLELELCQLGLVALGVENIGKPCLHFTYCDASKSNQSPIHGPECQSSTEVNFFLRKA